MPWRPCSTFDGSWTEWRWVIRTAHGRLVRLSDSDDVENGRPFPTELGRSESMIAVFSWTSLTEDQGNA
jgi:hypothetical protein